MDVFTTAVGTPLSPHRHATFALATLAFATSSAHAAVKLVAPSPNADARFGYSVAASDGTAIIGAPGDATSGSLSGSAFAHVKASSGWPLQQRLAPSDPLPDSAFGATVAIAGDTAIVGAPYATGPSASNAGAVYVFVRTGTAWTQQAKLVASDGFAFDYFGSSLAIAGNTVVVGAPYADVFGADSGAAYVFVRAGTTWSQQAKVSPADGRSGDLFGAAVSASGNTLAAGAPSDDDNAVASGSVYVFVRAGSSWTLQSKLRPTDGADGDLFGNAVSLDGNTLAVGAPDDDDRGLASGSVYLYGRAGTTWSAGAKLTASDGHAGDFFGSATALTAGQLVVGAPFGDAVSADSGAAYRFDVTGASASPRGKLTAFDAAADDDFGASVAIAGSSVIVGSEQDDQSATDAGAAYVFETTSQPVPATRPLPLAALSLILTALGVASLGSRRVVRVA